MKTQQDSPDKIAYVLLVGVGMLIALMLPLSKSAMGLGVSPLAYAFWQALGGGLLVFLWSAWQVPPWRQANHTRYAIISGLTAIAIPNSVAFMLVGKLGAGMTATYYALPALLTYGLALAAGMEQASRVRTLGLVLGMLGCLWILWPRNTGLPPGMTIWLAIGLAVPFSLAVGNIYRSLAWPRGASAHQLAYAMLFAAAVCLAGLLMLRGELGTLHLPEGTVRYLLCVQCALTALGYLGYFELQRRTSPVFISQLGYVITLAGLGIGVWILDEPVRLAVWAGVLIVLLGVFLANRREAKPAPASISDNR